MLKKKANTVDPKVEIDVLHFSKNIEMSEDIHDFSYEKIIAKIFYIYKIT